ncbi:hypothetical protein EXN66_Car014840 [Channa argus]|uniref:Uncharacterized protein n=1 Tax=Channa argus TaxID=215402 RepID=A0A6G1Q9Z8_CHAAH|nr:hypothetical protein EXN66_Car014840 [Channa argus]
MFIWEPHGCRPSLHGDASQLQHLEQLNDTHTPFCHATLPGQDNIKGHRHCDEKRGTSPITLGCDKRKRFTSE